ncbi:AzlC family ABC transporter permease [Erwinia phyllosphaerae]|uniref:AzlC family ABC transporter permease n=1 Tax=Erwinia phyllosphaerae TaxID=2853256 RepID=UPI001FEECC4B|nr:AzlC family ABC transporter permease [Erwinia phyllosphaerae]MBV4368437.1 AzlC family ABC transporter permease [Erwinia phyllosphaerae]
MSSSNSQALSERSFSEEVWRGMLATLPILIGILPFGLLLGAQAQQQGFSLFNLTLMTGLNFAGGSEFAAVALWASPPPLLTIVLVTLLVNSRHLLMGAALAPSLAHLPPRKALFALFLMCDESWAMSITDVARRRAAGLYPSFNTGFYAGVAGSLWFTWIFATGLGVIVGPVLGDITRWGFDMAFPAVFLVLLKGMWKGFRSGLPWLVSLICAGATYHYFPGAAYVPVGAASGIIAILLLNRKVS